MTRKILIVDDSKLARMAVVKALNALHPDWPRVEAANATEALSRIEEDSPDVALLDFNMPGKDGLALAVELQRSHPQLHVAVISANQQSEVIQRAREAGAAFLAKPLSEKALAQYLGTLPVRSDAPR